MLSFQICSKCKAKIYAVGELNKCPSCGHYFNPAAFGKARCDCEYCKQERGQIEKARYNWLK